MPRKQIASSIQGTDGAGAVQDVVHELMKAGTTTRPHQDLDEDYTGDLNSSRFFKVLPLALIMFFNVVLTKG